MSSTTTTTVTQAGTAMANGTNKSSTTLLADTDPDALLSEWLGELENLIGVSLWKIFEKFSSGSSRTLKYFKNLLIHFNI